MYIALEKLRPPFYEGHQGGTIRVYKLTYSDTPPVSIPN